MRAIVRFLGNRYGIAATLTVAILLIVGVAKLAGSNGEPAIGPDIAASPVATTDDDGFSAAQPTPTPFAGTAVSPPGDVATGFAKAWTNHVGVSTGKWLDGLRDLATADLMAKLKDTDPAGVPANRITGGVTLDVRDSRLIEATIPVDSGKLVLRLIVQDGQWLVDGVDWGRE